MSNLNRKGIELLNTEKIIEFNRFRMENLTFKLDLNNHDFSGKNFSSAFLNGVICNNTNF